MGRHEKEPVTLVSEPGKIIGLEWKKIGKGAIMAGIGSGLTYAVQEMGQVDFGDWQVVVAAGLAILSNIVHKLFYKTEYLKERV